MSSEEFDLEGYWKDIRSFPQGECNNSPSKIQQSLTRAFEKSFKRLSDKYTGVKLDPQKGLVTVVHHGIELFMEEWKQDLRNQNLAGLIGIVLEGQDLTPDEMKKFVQALPYTLLKRICQSAFGSATGVHGLMAIELASRNRSIREYHILQDGISLYVRLITLDGRHVKFYLNEEFNLSTDWNESNNR